MLGWNRAQDAYQKFRSLVDEVHEEFQALVPTEEQQEVLRFEMPDVPRNGKVRQT